MGARLAHLKHRADFLRARAQGRSCAAKGLVLQMRPHGEAERGADGLDGPRVGFTVTRKVGGAVERNRIKRRLRALAEETLGPKALANAVLPQADYVLIGRKATLGRSFSALRADLGWALRKLDEDRAENRG
ncbi:MAG: ribonuclease P protein component [Rhodospirillales bacterium]|jgi:ribonuclease P protein component|nr:ribonuclease P protein component [Rhodospirillales bacterium]